MKQPSEQRAPKRQAPHHTARAQPRKWECGDGVHRCRCAQERARRACRLRGGGEVVLERRIRRQRERFAELLDQRPRRVILGNVTFP